MAEPDDVLAFWLDKVGPDGWYRSDDKLDQDIRDQFLDAWRKARAGACSLWLTYPSGTLAYIILTDQFSRNMFRGSGTSFANIQLPCPIPSKRAGCVPPTSVAWI